MMSGRPDLPPRVSEYVARVLPAGAALPRSVHITQTGTMWRQREGRAMGFTATQDFTVDEVGFVWQARFPLAGRLAIDVVDRYDAAGGSLEVRLLGVRVARTRGQDVTLGEATRYLAELPLVPHAALANDSMEWSERADGRIGVATNVGSLRAEAWLEFDERGDIVAAGVDSRPRSIGRGRSVPTPFRGVYSHHAEFGGVRIPTRAEAVWELPDGPFTYWSAEVTSLESQL
jgi:hypothetical protein